MREVRDLIKYIPEYFDDIYSILLRIRFPLVLLRSMFNLPHETVPMEVCEGFKMHMFVADAGRVICHTGGSGCSPCIYVHHSGMPSRLSPYPPSPMKKGDHRRQCPPPARTSSGVLQLSDLG